MSFQTGQCKKNLDSVVACHIRFAVALCVAHSLLRDANRRILCKKPVQQNHVIDLHLTVAVHITGLGFCFLRLHRILIHNLHGSICHNDLVFLFQFQLFGGFPPLLQLYLAEIAVDGLKLASMNTPDMLTNSLSVIGGLILGEFAVGIGWLSADVIFYIALVAIAGFSQQNHELGYAFKFLRMLWLGATALFGIWGYLAFLPVFPILLVTNKTLSGGRSYLYPLIPFNGRALLRLFFRLPKRDVSHDKHPDRVKK